MSQFQLGRQRCCLDLSGNKKDSSDELKSFNTRITIPYLQETDTTDASSSFSITMKVGHLYESSADNNSGYQ